MPRVKFTSALKRFYPELKELSLEAKTVKSTVDQLEDHYPGLKNYLIEENGTLREHVNIYVGNELIVDRKGLSDEVQDKDEVYFFQALSGG